MIAEPSTLATDYALAVVGAWLGWRLNTLARTAGHRGGRLWSAAFGAMAAGSFFGGTYHGFFTSMRPLAARVVWTTTTILVGFAACLLLSATIVATRRQGGRSWLLPSVWIQFGIYVIWMLRHDDFFYVIVEYGAAMLLIVGLLVSNAAVRRQEWARWTIAGIATSIAAAFVQQSGVDAHQYLNHNDLQHLVQMVGLFLLYRGGARLIEAPERRAASPTAEQRPA
jgi:small-conductance mechanosensitive channel